MSWWQLGLLIVALVWFAGSIALWRDQRRTLPPDLIDPRDHLVIATWPIVLLWLVVRDEYIARRHRWQTRNGGKP